MTRDFSGFHDEVTAKVRKNSKTNSGLVFKGWVKAVLRDPEGNIKWVDEGPNIVVNEGIDYILGTGILDSSTLYLGLLTASPTPVAGWTMTDASGSEAAGYSSDTRPLWGQDAVASQVVSNGTAVSYTMDGTDTSVGGAFITTDSTKDGTTGTLIAAKEFTGGNKSSIGNGDILEVTYSITGSSS